MDIAITNFYKFAPLSEQDVESIRALLLTRAAELHVQGLVVLAREGINATIAGSPDSIEALKAWLTKESVFAPLEFKDSRATKMPFRRFKVDVRPEIVTFGHATATEQELKASMLSPQQWHERMTGGEKPILIDLRNTYETALGTFRGAVDPHIDVFTEFPAFIEKAHIPRDREILMYCTGGIRCEKAFGYMQALGFTKARQLAGGILRYLEEFPNGEFQGECFVFDHRVAVDQELQPSERYKLCVQCGDPAEEMISCRNCGTLRAVCESCRSDPLKQACSKNCAYHLRRRNERGVNESGKDAA